MAATLFNKKKLAVAGGALLLVAGITAGGALVTANSTIFNNTFDAKTSGEVANGTLEVSGAPMTYTFAGTMDGESVTGYYVAKNTSTSKTLTVGMDSLLQPSDEKGRILARMIETRVAVDGGAAIDTGKLNEMKLKPANSFEIRPGQEVTVRIDAFVSNSAAFRALNLDGAKTVADYRFDSIAK